MMETVIESAPHATLVWYFRQALRGWAYVLSRSPTMATFTTREAYCTDFLKMLPPITWTSTSTSNFGDQGLDGQRAYEEALALEGPA